MHAWELAQNLPCLDLLVQQHTPCVSPPLFAQNLPCLDLLIQPHKPCVSPPLLAQNLLCLDLAKQLGIDIPDPFFTWLYGAALPAIAGARATGCRRTAN